MKTAVVFGLVAFTACTANVTGTSRENVDEEWQSFKIAHKRSYTSDYEESYRKSVFSDNKWAIDRHNELYEKGMVKYSMGMNQFGDLTLREFNERMNGYKPSYNGSGATRTFTKSRYSELPPEVDWRFVGCVTKVKSQGQCTADWAFSAIGAIEGLNFRRTKKLVALSEQQLVDCSNSNSGCNGGSTQKAFQYIISNNGVDIERTYPYEDQVGQCRYRPDFSVVDITGYVDVLPGDGNLAAAIAEVGPVSVAVYSGTRGFMFYSGGVFVERGCPTEINHAMLAVGYGVYPRTRTGVWIVKNSWGPDWGDFGYVSMSREQNNICGISESASYPVYEPPW